MPALLPDDRPARAAFPAAYAMATRWRDNDVFAHLNNAVYYDYFDTAVNRWLVESGALAVPHGPVVGLVAETACRFFAPVGFPETVTVGLRAEHVGGRAVTYGLAMFAEAGGPAAAVCRFTHVYVDAQTRRPTPLPDTLRARLAQIAAT